MNSKQKGFALICAMIFLCIFATFAVSICSMSNTNLQIAQNYSQHSAAFRSAESGLNITRYWMADPNANSFAGIPHNLNAAEQRYFIVEVEETADPNVLLTTITGFAGEYQYVIGGDFYLNDSNDPNGSWYFNQNTYWENKK
ncbi:MAG: hypothetical protein FVQ85_02945 [Planctomycetes bacterium]|nr:hypothetical protein [Planctomycetota bacterium]